MGFAPETPENDANDENGKNGVPRMQELHARIKGVIFSTLVDEVRSPVPPTPPTSSL